MEPGVTPQCDYHYMWSRPLRRCHRPAAVRVFRSHGGGVNPVYKERCLHHAAVDLGPRLAAFWDDEKVAWYPDSGR